MNSFYTPTDFELQYPISCPKILHFVSQDSEIAYRFIVDILEQHIDMLECQGLDNERLNELYEIRESLNTEMHKAAQLCHTMASIQPFNYNLIDSPVNYIFTLLNNGLPIPYDTPEVYLRKWAEGDSIPTFIPIMGRENGYYRPTYTRNRIRGVPNYPEFVNYEDEEFLEKFAYQRQPPAAPITFRKRNPTTLEKDASVELGCRRNLQDVFNDDFELLCTGNDTDWDLGCIDN
jgi:hypothetical protein